jgi:hypothetical protein
VRPALALLLLAAVAAGCGGGNSKPAAHADPFNRLTLPAVSAHGHWVKAFVSPDLKTVLAQWSGECEAQSAYFVSRGGKLRPVTGAAADESIALGWVGRRARILVPRAACGAQYATPGIYLVDPAGGKPVLVRRLKPRPGGA